MRAKLFILLLVLGIPFVSASGMEVLPNCYDDLSTLFSTYNLAHDAGTICSPVIGNVVKISKSFVSSSSGQQNTLYLPTPLLQDLIPREQISCADPSAITIAWLNLESGEWKEIHSDAQELAPGLFTVVSDPENNAEWQDVLDNVSEGDFYLGVVKKRRPISTLDACVELDCGNQLGFYAYDTYFDPLDRSLVPTQTITFNVCGVPKGCVPAANGVCDKECSQGIDPDCGLCTEQAGDCCDISGDGVCDADCGEGVDPDCVCSVERDGCCTGNYNLEGVPEEFGLSDPDCTAGNAYCVLVQAGQATEDIAEQCTADAQGCSSESGDCCNFIIDGICDNDCLQNPISLENGSTALWYSDPDCCQGTLVQGSGILQGNGVEFASSSRDGCCSPKCDGACDDDCFPGVDPDCGLSENLRGSNCIGCGNGICEDDLLSIEEIDRLDNKLRQFRNRDPVSFVAMFESEAMHEALLRAGLEDLEISGDMSNPDIRRLVDALAQLNENADNCPEDCA